MRGIKLALFLIGIDRECLQEVLVDSTDKVLLLELLLINLINLVNYRLENIGINSCIGEDLLWQSILQSWDFVVKRTDGIIKCNSHQLWLYIDEMIPTALLLQEEDSVHTV